MMSKLCVRFASGAVTDIEGYSEDIRRIYEEFFAAFQSDKNVFHILSHYTTPRSITVNLRLVETFWVES